MMLYPAANVDLLFLKRNGMVEASGDASREAMIRGTIPYIPHVFL